MNVILEKDGNQVKYNAGPAHYLLLSFIPAVGGILSLVFTILKKQFRGVILNQIIIVAILITASYIIAWIGSSALALIYLIFVLILNIMVYVTYVLKANYFSVKQRLIEGYTVVNIDQPEVQAFVQKAQTIKKPFWQFTKF